MSANQPRPPAWHQRNPLREDLYYPVTVMVTVWTNPTNETLVESVHNKRGGSIEQVIRDEIHSNLESLSYVARIVVATDPTKETRTMTVRFASNDKGSPVGKLADAELHFSGGPLDGLKLVGFAVWERKAGGRNVTMPARQYSVNGERRSYAMLRPIQDQACLDRLRDLIVEAYKEYETQLADTA